MDFSKPKGKARDAPLPERLSTKNGDFNLREAKAGSVSADDLRIALRLCDALPHRDVNIRHRPSPPARPSAPHRAAPPASAMPQTAQMQPIASLLDTKVSILATISHAYTELECL